MVKHTTKKNQCKKCLRKTRKCSQWHKNKCRKCTKCKKVSLKSRSRKSAGGSFLGEVKGGHIARKKNNTRKHRKQSGGGWGITNAFRGIQYNLVKLGNNFAGKSTPSSANPYPTQDQYAK